MGWFSESEYDKLKKLVDESGTIAKNSSTPGNIFENMQQQIVIMNAINGAVQSGKISSDEEKKLKAVLAEKMGIK